MNNNNNKLQIKKEHQIIFKNINELKSNYLQIISDNLNKIKLKKDSIYNKYLIEKNNLIIKYHQKYKEIYNEINSLVLSKENPIKNYWYKILINCNFFDMSINDRNILFYLYLIEFVPIENSLNFSVKFHFKENEYFSPLILEKKYFFDFKGNVSKTESTKIVWKSENSNPTIENQTKEIVNNLNTFKKTIVKKIESFFNIFDSFETGKNNKNVSTNFIDDSESDNNCDYDEIVENLKEESNFFKNDFFKNQLEYYLNIMEIHFVGDIEDDQSSSSNEKNEFEFNKIKKHKFFRKNKKKRKKKNKKHFDDDDDCQNQ